MGGNRKYSRKPRTIGGQAMTAMTVQELIKRVNAGGNAVQLVEQWVKSDPEYQDEKDPTTKRAIKAGKLAGLSVNLLREIQKKAPAGTEA